jgi:hypothetical protein
MRIRWRPSYPSNNSHDAAVSLTVDRRDLLPASD